MKSKTTNRMDWRNATEKQLEDYSEELDKKITHHYKRLKNDQLTFVVEREEAWEELRSIVVETSKEKNRYCKFNKSKK